MPAVGGSIEGIGLNGRPFPVASDADTTKMLGGASNEVQMNGNGTGRLVKTVVGWSIDGLQIEINDSRADHEYLQEIANGHDFIPITITFASGVCYQGTGIIVDDIGASSQSATATIKLAGPGSLTQQ